MRSRNLIDVVQQQAVAKQRKQERLSYKGLVPLLVPTPRTKEFEWWVTNGASAKSFHRTLIT